MADEKIFRSISGNLRQLVIVVLLVLCVGLIFWAWSFHRQSVLREEERSLIDSMAQSVSSSGKARTPVRVALFDAGLDDGSATKDLKRIFQAESTFSWKTVSPFDIQAGALKEFNVVVFPGGFAPKHAEVLGESGKQAVQKFVQDGGGYVGICGGAFLATANYQSGMELINAEPLTGEIDVPGEGTVSMKARGGGTVKMELTAGGIRILGDLPVLLDIKYSGGPIFLRAGLSDFPEYVSLAMYRTEVWKYEPQKGTMIDTPAIIAGRFGKGHVILFSPHPESTKELETLVVCAIRATARPIASR
jgi:glutamine amidotransferase-like uncharacterized protein